MILTFSCSDEWIRNTSKDFVETFYTYDFTGIVVEVSSDEEIDFDLEVEAPTKEAVNNSAEVSEDPAKFPVSVKRQQQSCCMEKIIF